MSSSPPAPRGRRTACSPSCAKRQTRVKRAQQHGHHNGQDRRGNQHLEEAEAPDSATGDGLFMGCRRRFERWSACCWPKAGGRGTNLARHPVEFGRLGTVCGAAGERLDVIVLGPVRQLTGLPHASGSFLATHAKKSREQSSAADTRSQSISLGQINRRIRHCCSAVRPGPSRKITARDTSGGLTLENSSWAMITARVSCADSARILQSSGQQPQHPDHHKGKNPDRHRHLHQRKPPSDFRPPASDFRPLITGPPKDRDTETQVFRSTLIPPPPSPCPPPRSAP